MPRPIRTTTGPTPIRASFLAICATGCRGTGATALVAFAPDGSALGFLIFDIETREATWMVHAQRRGMLHHIAVDRAHRRSGIGSALIEAMKARLRAQGVTRVRTGYAAFNAPSAALMRKAGLELLHITAEGPV